MQTNQVIKLGVALVLVIGAIWWYRSRSADDIPNDPQSKSFFMCSECKYVQELTDREYAERKQATALAQAESSAAGGRPRVGRAAQQTMLLQCTNCKKFTAKPAVKCAKDGEIFIAKNDDGSPAKCPKCGTLAGSPPSRN